MLDDDDGDAEERYRRIQAEQEAKNIGAAIGLVAGFTVALTRDQQLAEEQRQVEEQEQQAEQTQ
ncbi:MAG: hypothetical protein KH842_02830 [Firmicutes bacterium]|nr:hypothetical protein [Bacillota bacterium]